MSLFIFWYPKVYIWMCTNHYARKLLMWTKKQKVRVEYLAMKIQLSPVTISPSMYIPLPLPHMPTKITKITSNDLLPAAQRGSPPLTISILTIFSPVWDISPCHKIVSLRLFPKFRFRLLNALRIECSVSTKWLVRVFFCRRFLSADKIARLATSETKWSCCPTTWRASHLLPLVSVGTQRGESCWYGSRSRLHLTRNDHSPTTNVWHLSLFEPETDISPNSRIVSSSICTYLVQIKRSKVFKSSNNGVKFIHCILFPAFSFKRNTPV